MGLLAWIQKQFGIPMNVENESNHESAPAKEGVFKVLRIQPTPNPDAFQFILNGKVIEAGTKTFDSPDDAGEDPMAQALFGIFGMQSIFIKENFVTITKANTVGWHTIMEKIGGAIEAHLHFYEKGTDATGDKDVHPVLEDFIKEDFFTYNNDRKTEVINALLDVAIRPALANDGGGINLLSVEDKTIKVHYQGACGSCPSSTTGTLQYIEQFLKEAIHPDVEVQAS
ncbi:MAG: NifU family protein [Nitrospinae bacterium]|nr:NifU family protein [Nitrospinota bacterium]MBL7021594.1 NifU family protein [Nitrospinaceae bacterium]